MVTKHTINRTLTRNKIRPTTANTAMTETNTAITTMTRKNTTKGIKFYKTLVVFKRITNRVKLCSSCAEY